MTVSFREEVKEIESMPKINTVEINNSEDQEILEVTPDTVDPEDRTELESVLKSVVPNYTLSEDQQNTVIAVHYEKSSNTYKIFGTIQEDQKEPEEPQEIKDDILEEFTDSMETENVEEDEDNSE